MKVYRHLNEFKGAKNPVLSIGIFDGVHLGHQKILKRLVQSSKEKQGESVLLSFFPHPRMIIEKDASNLRLLNTLDEKISLLERLGLDHLILHPFDHSFSEMSSADYIENILVDQIGAKKIIIGYDHHFGKDREGSFDQLREFGRKFGFELEEIPAQDLENVNISSTKIRKALFEGDVHLANQFLGYHYFLRGTVIEGDKIGRSISFPTANIYIEEKYKLIPRNGVYASEVLIGQKKYKGMLNIGNRPTLPGKEFSIEVHILDFNEEIYGQTIQVSLFERIRDEVKFDNLSALETQLNLDKEEILKTLK